MMTSLFASLFRPRARHVATIATTTLISWGAGIALAWYVDTTSTSVGTNLVLIALWVASLILTGYVEAAFIGALLFGDAWLGEHFLGEPPNQSESAAIASPVKHSRAVFTALLLVSFLANVFGANEAAGGFFGAYHRSGFAETLLRSPSPDERAQGVERLRDFRDARVISALRRAFADTSVDVRLKAARQVARAESDVFGAELRTLALDSDARATPDRAIEIAFALGRVRVPPAFDALSAIAASPDERTAATAIWAMGRADRDRSIAWSLAHLATEARLLPRCLMLYVLEGHSKSAAAVIAADVAPIVAAFDREAPATVCPALYAPSDREAFVQIPAARFGARIVEVLRNVAPRAMRPTLERMARRAGLPPEIAASLDAVARALNHR